MKNILTTAIFAVTIAANLLVFTNCSNNSESVKPDNANKTTTNISNISANNSTVPVTPPPVTTVNNNSSMPVAGNNGKTTAPPVKAPTPVVSSGANDLALFMEARSLIAADPDLVNKVIIEIKDGNAVLSGKVADEAQKSKVAQKVQSVKGIKSVKNNLTVSP